MVILSNSMEDGSSVGSAGSLRSSGTCTSGIDRAQPSDDGSNGDKSKVITTSARGNDLSDNKLDASDGDDVKMSNIDGSMLKKHFARYWRGWSKQETILSVVLHMSFARWLKR